MLQIKDYKMIKLYDKKESHKDSIPLDSLKEGEKISILSDSMMKTMFQNEGRIKYSVKLLSYFLDVSYEELLNNIYLVKNELDKKNESLKSRRADYVANINGSIINIEVNNNSSSKTLERNMEYAHRLYASKVRRKKTSEEEKDDYGCYVGIANDKKLLVEEVPYGSEGEIVITGPTVMAGYIRNKKETKQTLRKHKDGRIWLHTGDEGIMDSDGFVYFKGRLKRMIITSGYCVYPNNIENVIDSHPSVRMSCVIGIPHPYKVTVAKAFIVLKDGIEKNDEILTSIKELVEKNLARFSWPYDYEFRDELPKTLVGKVAYNVLIHEEEMKNKDKKFASSEELLEQVDDESSNEELLDKLKVDK